VNEKFAARLRRAVARAGAKATLESLRYRRAVAPDGCPALGEPPLPVAGAVLTDEGVLVLDPARFAAGRLSTRGIESALHYGRCAGAKWAVTWPAAPGDDEILRDLAFVQLVPPASE
jgi:hypothetical protein